MYTYLGAANNTYQGNHIGTDVTGTIAVPNGGFGFYLGVGTSDNLIGGPGAGEGNIVVNNGLDGIWLDSTAGTGNSILGNQIFGNGGRSRDRSGSERRERQRRARSRHRSKRPAQLPPHHRRRRDGWRSDCRFRHRRARRGLPHRVLPQPVGGRSEWNGEGEVFVGWVATTVTSGVPSPSSTTFPGSMGDIITATATATKDNGGG